MVIIGFDTNIVNALENADRPGSNKPSLQDFVALLNMLGHRRKGKCRIVGPLSVSDELLDCPTHDENYLRRHVVALLLDSPHKVTCQRHSLPDCLADTLGCKDARIVQECMALGLDYLITRDTALARKAKDLGISQPTILLPMDADELFRTALEGYTGYFDYLSNPSANNSPPAPGRVGPVA